MEARCPSDLLLHNVSHTDLVLKISCPFSPSAAATARPKYNKFRNITERLLAAINDSVPIAQKESYSRTFYADASSQYTIARKHEGKVPLGFDLSENPVALDDVSNLRFRQDERKNIMSNSCNIDGIYFPLLAILLPRWLALIESNGRGTNSKRTVVLISGRGTPVDTSANVIDNSTKFTGCLMANFIQRVYPGMEVIHLHSTTNLFRYDENIVFVKRELLPVIDSIRNEMAKEVGARWRELLNVTMSFADGSSARISSINASIRHYRPTYMHFWQLKTYWRENKLCEDDIECHSYEEITTDPALSIESFAPYIQSVSTSSYLKSVDGSPFSGLTPSEKLENRLVGLVLGEMTRFRRDFELAIASDTSSDLSSFWLRKTKKPVLAVLLVQKEGDGSQPKLYRGTNMEVSMPTGSLCAERNVIGTALADDMTLRRQDFKMIAVYSATSLDERRELTYSRETPQAEDFIPGTGNDGWSPESFELNVGLTPSLVPSLVRSSQRLRSMSCGGISSPSPLTINNTAEFLSHSRPLFSPSHLIPTTAGRPTFNHIGRSISSNELTEDSMAMHPPLSPVSRSGLSPSLAAGVKRKIISIPPTFAPAVTAATTSANLSHPPVASSTEHVYALSDNTISANSPHFQKRLALDDRTSVHLRASGSISTVVPASNMSTKSQNAAPSSISQTRSSSRRRSSFASSSSAGVGSVGTGKRVRRVLDRRESHPIPVVNIHGLVASELRVARSVVKSAGGDDSEASGDEGEGEKESRTYDAGLGNLMALTCGGAYPNPAVMGVSTILVEDNDMNPLKPCGACHEWLKKIAEVNPQFGVLTFTDVNCTGVYIEQIID